MLGIIPRLRRWRLGRRPFPFAWLPHVEALPFYQRLSPDLQRKFQRALKVFVWDKHFIGAGDMEITDEVRVTVAAAAVRLVLHLDLSYYDRLTEIVVYPDAYLHPERDGVVFGEAQSWGTVVLSWAAVRHGMRNTEDGKDTAVHEFAHVLDRADGEFDGTPELRAWSHYRPWVAVMSHHFLRLQARARPERRVLDSYGAQNEAEFFAVATETFFEKPEQMQEQMPELYEELRRFYGFDPAAE